MAIFGRETDEFSIFIFIYWFGYVFSPEFSVKACFVPGFWQKFARFLISA